MGGAKKKAAGKKAATRKVKIKAKRGTTRITIGNARKNPARKVVKIIKSALGIGAVSMSEIHKQHTHQASLHSAIAKHTSMLKTKGTTPAEKKHLRAEIKKYRQSITASKRHVSQLKRHI